MGIETITHTTEISASTETVRSIFLEYTKYTEWTNVWTWTPLNSGTKDGFDLQPGDQAAVKSKGIGSPTTLTLTLPSAPGTPSRHAKELTLLTTLRQKNTIDEISWRYEAKVPIMKVSHDFRFEPSEKTAGGTTFTNHEVVTGLLSFVMNPGRSYGKINAENFAEFGGDLKKRCETATVATQ